LRTVRKIDAVCCMGISFIVALRQMRRYSERFLRLEFHSQFVGLASGMYEYQTQYHENVGGYTV
jgi:hypothetical protein